MISRRRSPRLRLEIGHLVVLIPWLVLAIVARSPIRDNSFLWHIRAGTLQIDRGSVLTADPFSYTVAGRPWRTQSWLPELLYGQLERWFGLGFVWVMVAVVSLLTVIMLGLLAWRRPQPLIWKGIFLTASAIVMASYWNPRPALFSFVLFGLLILGVEEPRLRWTIPMIFWLWAATHGSWVIGGGYLVLQAIAGRSRRSAALIVPSVVAVLLTAHGWGVVDVLIEFAKNRSALALITEWAPANLASLGNLPILLGILFLIIPARRRNLSFSSLWILIPFVYLAASSTRSVPLAWLALAPFLVSIAEGTAGPRLFSPSADRPAVNLFLAAVMIAVPFFIARSPDIDVEHFPVAAANSLRSTNVFHDDTAGGYLIYAEWPARLVFIDDRAELYGDLVERFIRMRNGHGDWQTYFQEHQIDEALLRTSEPLAEVLRSEGWLESFRDGTYVVLFSS